MATIREHAERFLFDRCLWPEEAKEIVAVAEQSLILDAMKGRWDEPTAAYPPQLLAAVEMSLGAVAAEWLDKNAPQHFARGMFNRG